VPSNWHGTPVTGYKLFQYAGIAPNTQYDQVPVKNEIQTISTVALAAVTEIQRVDLIGVTVGTFTLRLGPYTTAPIANNAPGSTVRTALRSLPNVEDVAVAFSVTNATVNTWTITFTSFDGDVPTLFPDGTNLFPATSRVLVTEVVKGSPALTGDFDISFRGFTTVRGVSAYPRGCLRVVCMCVAAVAVAVAGVVVVMAGV
jgi:hypothetical protein